MKNKDPPKGQVVPTIALQSIIQTRKSIIHKRPRADKIKDTKMKNYISFPVKLSSDNFSKVNSITAQNKFAAVSAISGAINSTVKSGITIFTYQTDLLTDYNKLVKLLSAYIDDKGLKIGFCDRSINTDVRPEVNISHINHEIKDFVINTNLSKSTDVRNAINDFLKEYKTEKFTATANITLMLVCQTVTNPDSIFKLYPKQTYADSFAVDESKYTYIAPYKTTVKMLSATVETTEDKISDLDDVSDKFLAQFSAIINDGEILRNSILGIELKISNNANAAKRYPILYCVLPTKSIEKYENNIISSAVLLEK